MSVSVRGCMERLYDEICDKIYGCSQQLPASFAPISSFAVALLQFFIYRADNISHLLNLCGADSTPLSEVISDYFVGGNPEEEALGMLTLLRAPLTDELAGAFLWYIYIYKNEKTF